MPVPLLTETIRALSRAEHAAQVIARKAGRPQPYGPPDRRWWRYPDEDYIQAIAVKAVRAVSGLYACLELLHAGHTIEIGVLLRTVDDFTDEVTFLLDAHQTGKPTRAQKNFVEQFFREEVGPPADLLKDRPGPDRARRKDIRAAQGRYLSKENPDRMRRLAMAVDRTFDGYVHGAYPHSMELYDPNRSGGFRMQGTNGTPYPATYQRQVAFYVSRCRRTPKFPHP